MPHRRSPTITALAAALAAAWAALAGAAPAQAAPPCSAQADVRVLVEGRGFLESVGVDRRGRLFFTDSTSGELLKLRKPGAKPTVVAAVDEPGGIVFKRQSGNVVVGFGNSIEQASDGAANPEAGLLNVDPKTGRARPHVEGLQMANGVTRGPGRRIFASNDIAGGVDRVRKRIPTLNWAPVNSANGMVVDHERSNLFVNQTFQAAAITTVPLARPSAASVYYAAAPADAGAGLDGLARDNRDRLYVAANAAGQIWRVDGPGDACVLASRDPFPAGPSDLAFGAKRGKFPRSNLYVTTFGGELLELVDARG